MPKPSIGEMKSIYCKCIEKTRSEYSRDSFGITEKNISIPTPGATSWICKKDLVLIERIGPSSPKVEVYNYYWECMNCNRKVSIGKWDSNGIER